MKRFTHSSNAVSPQFVRHILATSIALAIAAPAMFAHTPAQAQTTAGARAGVLLNLPAAPLAQSLNALAQQAGVQIIYAGVVAEGRNAPALQGTFSAHDALQRLVAGSGLIVRVKDAKTFTVVAPDGGNETQTLPEVVVAAGSTGVSEGTGSYTQRGPTTTANGLGLTQREIPQSVSVVSHQIIDDKKYTSLDQALKDSPGIAVVQDIADGRWRYTSRGFNVSNIQYDGLTTEPVRDNLPQDDLVIYDRVEIVRGATGLMEGSGYPSATVNMIRKKPLHQPMISVNTSASSFGNGRAELDISRNLNASGSLRSRFVATLNGGDGYRDYNKQSNAVFYGVVEADLGPNTVMSAGLSYQKERMDGYSWGGLPTKADGSFFDFNHTTYFGNDWEYSDKKKTTAYLDVEHHFHSGWKAQISAQRTWATSDLLTSFLSDWALTNQFTKNDRFFEYQHDNYALNAQISGPVVFGGRTHDLTFGVSGRRDEQENSGYRGASYLIDVYSWDPKSVAKPALATYTKYYTTHYRQDEVGVYGAGRLRLTDNLALIAGGRISWFDYFSPTTPSAYSENGKFIPYAGFVYDLTKDSSVYASYTSIFRAQNRIDAQGGFLRPIDGDNYEIGLKTSALNGRLNGSIALFQIDLTNLPESVAASQCQVSVSCYRAGERVRSRGVELELSGNLAERWNIAAGYTYANPKYDAGPNRGDRYNAQAYPKHMFKLFTSYAFNAGPSGLTIGGGIRAFDQTHYDGGDYLIQQPFYAVTDAMVKYKFNDKASLQLNINNLFDKQYYGAISTYTGYGNHLGAPRELVVSFSYKY